MGSNEKPKSLKKYLIPIIIALLFILFAIAYYFLNRLMAVDAYIIESTYNDGWNTTTFQYEFLGKTYVGKETSRLLSFAEGNKETAYLSVINPGEATLDALAFPLGNAMLLVISAMPLAVGVFILMIAIPCYFIDKYKNKELQRSLNDDRQTMI